jgi:DNA polymerase sigma
MENKRRENYYKEYYQQNKEKYKVSNKKYKEKKLNNVIIEDENITNNELKKLYEIIKLQQEQLNAHNNVISGLNDIIKQLISI